MKKLLTFVALIGLVAKLSAATVTIQLGAGAFTNIFGLNNGSAKVTQFLLTSTATNIASVMVVDTPTNWLSFTNKAYTNIISYPTNYIAVWTNYYGATNYWTNLTLVDITNTVAATTNSYPVRAYLTTATNSTLRVDQANYYFLDGVWVTNTTPNSSTAFLTITYTQ